MKAATLNAIQREADIICLPELCITGYGCEDMFLSANTWQKAKENLERFAEDTKSHAIICAGLPVFYKGAVYNCVATIHHGRVIALHPKSHLAGDGVHYETRWFKPWPAGKVDLLGDTPIGDLIIQAGSVRIGYEICEDAWVASRPGQNLSQEGVQIILNPSASHFAFGKQETRKRFVLEGSRAFSCAYVYANLIGNESGRTVYDGGAMVALCGELLAENERFCLEPYQITLADINLNLLNNKAAGSASREVNEGATQNIVQTTQLRKNPNQTITRAKPNGWDSPNNPFLKEEEFTRAITLALRDYRRKSGTNGYVISLSGGADSSALACLCHYESLLENEAAKIPTRLTTVYQGTKNSSKTTRDAAKTLADALQATHYEIEVDTIVSLYTEAIEKAKGKRFKWENTHDDITLQNIQARARGPIAWMLANDEDKLLLSTSNRSEAAVGYATMDGDTCGALSPLAGIDKTFLRQWLRWAETQGPEGLHPIPELGLVNKQAPTAELRPQMEGVAQTDEKDLMPYPILGEIENSLIRDKLSPADCINRLVEKFPQYGVGSLAVWVDKFRRLWRRNQWKRERYAPGIHVDDKNLDPRSWLRYPLLSGPDA